MKVDGTKRWPVFLNLFLIALGIFLILAMVWPALNAEYFERASLERDRKSIYEASLQRVEKTGGWQAIENASLAYVKQLGPSNYFNGPHFYSVDERLTTNVPAIFNTLQPWTIDYDPDESGIPVLRIKLFGMRRTGRCAQPYYGIWVVCSNVPTGYVPQFSGDMDGRRGLIERKGDLIFEVR